ncbi:MAG: MATE family efflux transporter [Deltaproteobacteria bacterium]|nr:MATE family efflux transporter [Deltaproteobacteria bacterium]MBW2382514.1 MATE family efflux transporter [Deltaproteobacteria bacterium]MBW2695694.1 MATE family efflux transporter [Deltaproteobacteria bacterium]
MTIPLETSVREQPISRPGPPDSRPTDRGSVREVAVLAYPVVLTQLSMTTMGVVDSAMVGRLGSTELAAVGFGGIWMWTIFCGFIGTSTGLQTFISQAHGADEPERCGAWAWQGAWSLVPLTLLCAVVFSLNVDTLLAWLAPSAELQPLAQTYMSIRAFGTVGMVMATIFAAFFRGIGDTRTPLYVTLLANGLNAVLDYGLIFGKLGLPQWGVAGAATATAIAEWVYALVILGLFSRRALRQRYRTAPTRFSLRDQRRLIRLGLPIGGQWLLEMLSFAVFLTLVAHMGDTSLAASQAFIALLSLSFMQASGLGIALSTLVGRYIGANDTASAERSFRSARVLTLALSGIVAVLFVAIPEQLMRIFSDDPEVLALGGPLLLVGAVFQFFDAFGIMADGALRGAGDTRVPFLVRFLLAWGLFVPLAWWLGVYLEGGLTAAWLGGSVYVLVLSTYLVWRFQSGAWRHIRI